MSGVFTRSLLRQTAPRVLRLSGAQGGLTSSVNSGMKAVSAGRFDVSRRFAASLSSMNDPFDPLDTFAPRHSGSGKADLDVLLKTVGVKSLDDLTDKIVPASIQAKEPLKVGEPMTETEAVAFLKNMMSKNKLYQNHIGMGYAGTKTPYVVLRNLLENPAWYTQYTPYQAEVAQGNTPPS